MSGTNTMTAEPRDRAGKGVARATRRSGRVPAVIYGDHKDPILVSVEPVELTHQLHNPGFFSRSATTRTVSCPVTSSSTL